MKLIKRAVNHLINFTILRLFFCVYLLTGVRNCTNCNKTAAFTFFGSKQFVMGFISTVMFQRNSGVSCKVIVIDDGTLNLAQKLCLRRINAEVTGKEHNAKVHKRLQTLLHTQKFYDSFILMKKLVDVSVLSGEFKSIIFFDSDVLFTRNCNSFSKIVEDCSKNTVPSGYYNKDIEYSFIAPPERIVEEFGLTNMKCLNSGLFVCNPKLIDLEIVEKILQNDNFQSWTKNRLWVTEQTIYAILASQKNTNCKLLPENFDLQIPPNLQNETIHFVGAIRKQYWRGLLC